MNDNTIERIKNGLIVSCQAYEGDPLYGSETMVKMARAAIVGGAIGIRANGIDDIRAIRAESNLPMIGIIKANYENSDVYITPTFKELELLGETDVEIIALDGTQRKRPYGDELQDMIRFIKEDLNKIVMADVSTLDEALKAEVYGADMIAPTLSGYTAYTKKMNRPDWSLIEDLVTHLNIPIIAEGRIMTKEDAVKALNLGCHAVCVGTAITRPEVITSNFVKAISENDYNKGGN